MDIHSYQHTVYQTYKYHLYHYHHLCDIPADAYGDQYQVDLLLEADESNTDDTE